MEVEISGERENHDVERARAPENSGTPNGRLGRRSIAWRRSLVWRACVQGAMPPVGSFAHRVRSWSKHRRWKEADIGRPAA